MTYETRLRRVAERLARERSSDVDELKEKKLRLLNVVADLQEEITAREEAQIRFDTYLNVLAGDYQCPVCWITRGEKVGIAPAGDLGRVIYRCGACGWEDRHEF